MEYPELDYSNGEIRVLRLHANADTNVENTNCAGALHCSFEIIRLRTDVDHRQQHQVTLWAPDEDNFDLWRTLWDQPTPATSSARAPAHILARRNSVSMGYIALSYRWSHNSETEEIHVDNTRIEVSKNLADALRAIQSKGPATEGMRIWADALCVNQRDLVERNAHVSIMGSIYAMADGVIAWLGKESENSSLAIDLIYDLHAAWRKEEVESFIERASRLEWNDSSHGAWLALLDLTKREYWTRVWIIQELCLGNHSTVILCGERAVYWDILYMVLWTVLYNHLDSVVLLLDREHLEHRGTHFMEGHTPLLNRNFFYHVNLERALQSGRKEGLSRRNRENSRPGWHIMPMLDCARLSACSLDQDRVWGLYALLPESLRARLQPNYDLSVNETYLKLARAWIESKQDLEILSQCSLQRDTSLPSWAPDWRYAHIRLFTGANVPYHASSGMQPAFHFAGNGRVLAANGIHLDTIIGVRGVVQILDCGNAYGTLKELLDALWRTLVGNITTAGYPAHSESHRLLLLASNPIPTADKASEEGVSKSKLHNSIRLRQFQDMLETSGDLRIAGQALSSLIKSHQSEDRAIPTLDESLYLALEQTYRFSRLKRLAITAMGRFAMVPDGAWPGDDICILFGSYVPLVLRRVKGSRYEHAFEVVGGCYVHGVMNGEAMAAGFEQTHGLGNFHLL